ncbi:MAG TPA: hypothetical protein DHV93_05915 [Holophagaceae bacterium]|nr:hypothetical protein [Holophagaceae bacterium]
MEIRKDSMDLMIAEAREYEVKDTKLPGFRVRVSPKGLRTFIYRWSQDGKDEKAAIGRYPGIPVMAARNKAQIWYGMVSDGKNPRLEKQEKKATRKAARETMGELIDRYSVEVLPGHKPNTQRDYKSVLKALKARFGATPVRALDLEAIKAYHADLAATPRTANKQVKILSSVLTQAERWGLRDLRSNPCYLIEGYPETKRVRSLTPKEAVAFGKLLRQQAAGSAAVDILWLILYTGARPGELQVLEWPWVDLKAGVIRVPKEHHKTGRKTGEDRFIGLGPVAISILKARHKGHTSKWVFPNAKGTGPYAGLNTFWRRLHHPKDGRPDLLLKAGLRDFHLYDLRHTWATWARRGGQALEDLADMLGHTDVRMSRRYAHAQPDKLRAGAIEVERALGGKMRS